MALKFRKSIFTAASPNTQFDDVLLAIGLLFSPWNWNKKNYITKFLDEIASYTSFSGVYLVDSGRTALQVALQALGMQQDDEVLTPAFTCVVVANAVSYTGAKSIYLDTNKEDLNANYSEIEKYITQKTKAIIVQHTFGKMVDVKAIGDKLQALGRKDIKIVEDFAHVIYKGMELNGDVGILTFGIEKVISSVRGGAIVVNNEERKTKIEIIINKLPSFPVSKTLICLLNPIFWFVAIPLHSVGFGRFSIGALIRWFWRKLGFLGIMVEKIENHAIKPDWFPCQMSPALAVLGSNQLSKLDKLNEHRNRIAGIYEKYLGEISDDKVVSDQWSEETRNQEPETRNISHDSKPLTLNTQRVYLRYPIILTSPEQYLKVWNLSRELRVTLGNWFSTPLYGAGVDQETYKRLSYDPSSTPETLRKCAVTLNLPTSVNMSEWRAEELAREISKVIEG